MKKQQAPFATLASAEQKSTRMKNRVIRFIPVAFLAMSICGIGSAQAEVLKGGVCTTSQSRITGAEHVWHCEYLGRVTIRQIYEKGFRVVSAYSSDPAEKMLQFQYLIIEEQGK